MRQLSRGVHRRGKGFDVDRVSSGVYCGGSRAGAFARASPAPSLRPAWGAPRSPAAWSSWWPAGDRSRRGAPRSRRGTSGKRWPGSGSSGIARPPGPGCSSTGRRGSLPGLPSSPEGASSRRASGLAGSACTASTGRPGAYSRAFPPTTLPLPSAEGRGEPVEWDGQVIHASQASRESLYRFTGGALAPFLPNSPFRRPAMLFAAGSRLFAWSGDNAVTPGLVRGEAGIRLPRARGSHGRFVVARSAPPPLFGRDRTLG